MSSKYVAACGVLFRSGPSPSHAELEAYIDEQRKTYHADNPTLANVVDDHSRMKQGGH